MSRPRVPHDTNVTLRVDADVLLWARARSWFGGTSVNELIRGFLAEYAAVPQRWRDGLGPPWTAENRVRPVMDPVGAGPRAAGTDPESARAVEAIAAASCSRQG
jgi:hypothetical protein